MKKNKTKKLFKIFQAIDINPSPSEIDLLFEIYQKREYQKAVKLGLLMTRKYPFNQFSWKILGSSYRALGYLNDSVIASKKAISLKGNDAEVYNNLGNVLKDLGELEEAKSCYVKAIALKSSNSSAYNNLALLLKDTGELEEAESNALLAISSKPSFAEAHNNLGSIQFELGRPNESVISYRTAIAFKPDYAEAHNNLGAILQELDNLYDAEKSYKKAIELNPKYAEALINYASLCLIFNRIIEAEEYYKEAVTFAQGDLRYKSNIGLCINYFIKNKLIEAREIIINNSEIIKNKSKKLKNEIKYYNYLSLLIDWHIKNKYIDKNNDSMLYVIGESHALSSHGLIVNKSGNKILCEAKWMVGCKQWHFGSENHNKFKEKFERIVQSLPFKSRALIVIGEIDCRLDEGILAYLNKNSDCNQSEVIKSTINNFIKYIYKITQEKLMKIIIQGVPCPNYNLSSEPNESMLKLVLLINEFNVVLKEYSIKMNFEFLDVQKLTNRGDGFSNGDWKIDMTHISPSGMLKVLQSHEFS